MQMLKGGTNGNNNALDVSLFFSILPLQNCVKIPMLWYVHKYEGLVRTFANAKVESEP